MRTSHWLILVVLVVSGCRPSSSPSTSSTGDEGSNSSALVVGPSSASSDPAQTVWEAAPITVDTPPEIICRQFIEALQHGENNYAEKLLSQESITNTRRHELDLATPAGPGASYTISPPTYATSQQKIAFVSVAVMDRDHTSGEPQPFTLMLRKSGYGWKISGIMLGSESETQDLYSFENPLDVQRIKAMIEGDQRQAAADDGQAAMR